MPIGLGFSLANRDCAHQVYRCCIDTNTKWNARGGLSLGLFIFTPKDDVENAQPIRVHEYGHTIQPLVLGSLMLLVGIVCVVWGGNLPYFARLRREKGVPYTACFVEYRASKMGRAGYQRAGGVVIRRAEGWHPAWAAECGAEGRETLRAPALYPAQRKKTAWAN